MRDKSTGNQMDFYNIFIKTSSKMILCIFLQIVDEKMQKVENNPGMGDTIRCQTSVFLLHWIKSKNHHISSSVEG